MQAKPFLQWAGGKRQLISDIDKKISKCTFTKYAEPFVGGGAVLFHVLNNYPVKEVWISDTNETLISTYKIIRDNPTLLITKLKEIQNDFLSVKSEDRKAFYLQTREMFNVKQLSEVDKAALFIFLNHTCFNGLYRVNKKGYFNVPMGTYKNPIIYNAENILGVSKLLKNAEIRCCDYSKSKNFITKDTLVYLDPPYRPLSTTSSFTSYGQNGFSDENQKELAQFVRKIDSIGANFILSNSNPKNSNPEDTFFEDLYKGFEIEEVFAKRSINCVATKRNKISELLISNIGGDKI